MKRVILALLVAAAIVTSCSKDDNGKEPQTQKQINNNSGGGSNSGGNTQQPKKEVKKTTYEVVTLIKEQNFWLYSKTGSGSGRNVLSFELPKNIYGLYYSVSTSRSKSAPVKDLKLAEQLTEQIKKNPYIPPINLSSVITVPDTKQTDKVQVILMESINKDLFLSDGNYEYNKLGSSFYGTEKELFEVTLLPYIQFPNNPYFTNKYSLGFYNSNYFDGFSVTVEAVAIIKKEITVYE